MGAITFLPCAGGLSASRLLTPLPRSLSAAHSSSLTSFVGLLVAGQGSRLWGISASTGFVKALVTLFRTTLFELTVAEARMLISQAPQGGRDMVLMAGTDNVLVPSIFPLRTVGGGLFSALPSLPSLTLFSKAVAVLDENLEPLPHVSNGHAKWRLR